MKYTILSLILIFFCHAINAQDISQKISINLRNVTLKEFFNQIEAKTAFSIVFRDVILNESPDVIISASDRPLNEVLSQVLDKQSLSYKISNNTIVIVKTTNSPSKDKPAKTITGTVVDDTGIPIIGANIVIKGTTLGTITDINGTFSINTSQGDLLTVSYIGYLPQEILVSGANTLSLTLKEDTQGLEEVIVIGYGTVKKRDLTGSVQNVKSKDLTAVPTNNVLETLQGKISGLDMSKSSGQAGAGLSFNIRGNRSLSASNSPLIIVDGFPVGSTLDLNATDIESIEVLKDASSTAIYGTRGANGVILVTTKKGNTGKSKVSLNMYYTINERTSFPAVMDGDQFAQYKREAYRTTNGNEMSTGSFVANPYRDDKDVFPAALEYEYLQNKQYEYWPDLIFKTGHTQNYEANISGGNDNTKYTTSLGFMNEEGIIPNDVFKRFNFRVGLDHKLSNTVRVGSNILFTYKDQDSGYSAFSSAIQQIPIAKSKDDDGSIRLFPSPGYTTKMNPTAYYDIKDSYVNNQISKKILANVDLEWEIIENLKFKTLFSAQTDDVRKGEYIENFESVSTASAKNNQNLSYQSQNTLIYSKLLNSRHDFQVLAGQEFQSGIYESYSASGKGQFSSINSFHALQSTTSAQNISSYKEESSLMSFFGRINYKLDDKYMFALSLRADRSSVLAKENQWGYFPAAAAAWRINEEAFLKDVESVSNLKLRASWGLSGNSAIGPYKTLGGISQSYYTTENQSTPGYYPSSFPNKDLTWETTSSYNFGLDFGFFRNRLSGNVDFFVSNTSDLLMTSQVPSTSGYKSIMKNVGETKNIGIEGTISALIIDCKDFTWNMDINYSHVKDEITALNSGQSKDEGNAWFVGKPIKAFYDYKKIGIWQIDEYEEAKKYGLTYGEIKVDDTNKDGTIDPEDRIVYKQSPDFVFGFNNSLTYKNFDLSAFIYGRIGQWIRYERNGSIFRNGLENSIVHNYWTPENPTNDFPRPTEKSGLQNYSYWSTLRYKDGSFIKLRDITLGYTFPQSIIGQTPFSSLRFYATMKNYITWSKIKDYDPERGGSASFPLSKQIVFGLNVSF